AFDQELARCDRSLTQSQRQATQSPLAPGKKGKAKTTTMFDSGNSSMTSPVHSPRSNAGSGGGGGGGGGSQMRRVFSFEDMAHGDSGHGHSHGGHSDDDHEPHRHGHRHHHRHHHSSMHGHSHSHASSRGAPAVLFADMVTGGGLMAGSSVGGGGHQWVEAG